MRVFGIGIDVVEVERIAAAIERGDGAFLRKVFTEAEREYCEAKKNAAVHFAARFAAKEAVAKAFGTGIGASAGWQDIEVLNDAAGAPKVEFHGAAREFMNEHRISSVQVSLTHAKAYAAANAVALVE